MGGNLICCDTCPKAFHQTVRCCGAKKGRLPKGDGAWSCPFCRAGQPGCAPRKPVVTSLPRGDRSAGPLLRLLELWLPEHATQRLAKTTVRVVAEESAATSGGGGDGGELRGLRLLWALADDLGGAERGGGTGDGDGRAGPGPGADIILAAMGALAAGGGGGAGSAAQEAFAMPCDLAKAGLAGGGCGYDDDPADPFCDSCGKWRVLRCACLWCGEPHDLVPHLERLAAKALAAMPPLPVAGDKAGNTGDTEERAGGAPPLKKRATLPAAAAAAVEAHGAPGSGPEAVERGASARGASARGAARFFAECAGCGDGPFTGSCGDMLFLARGLLPHPQPPGCGSSGGDSGGGGGGGSGGVEDGGVGAAWRGLVRRCVGSLSAHVGPHGETMDLDHLLNALEALHALRATGALAVLAPPELTPQEANAAAAAAGSGAGAGDGAEGGDDTADAADAAVAANTADEGANATAAEGAPVAVAFAVRGEGVGISASLSKRKRQRHRRSSEAGPRSSLGDKVPRTAVEAAAWVEGLAAAMKRSLAGVEETELCVLGEGEGRERREGEGEGKGVLGGNVRSVERDLLLWRLRVQGGACSERECADLGDTHSRVPPVCCCRRA